MEGFDGLISRVRSASGGSGSLQICLGGKVGPDWLVLLAGSSFLEAAFRIFACSPDANSSSANSSCI
jgi:hypothetical protein